MENLTLERQGNAQTLELTHRTLARVDFAGRNEALAAALGSPDAELRRGVADFLYWSRIDFLIEQTKSDDVQRNAAEAVRKLRRFPIPAVQARLERALESDDPQLRRYARLARPTPSPSPTPPPAKARGEVASFY